jgi:hypothetical protein
MRKSHFEVRVVTSAYFFKCIMLYSHGYSCKLCSCVLFNHMFQNSRGELIDPYQEQLEMDTEIRRL